MDGRRRTVSGKWWMVSRNKAFTTDERQLMDRLVLEYPVFYESGDGFNDQCMYCYSKPKYISQCKTDPKWPGSSHYHTEHKSDCAWIAGMRYLGREISHDHLAADPS